SQADLRGDKRPQSIAYPRHIAMYLCRELTDQSLPKIGAKFGGRDHSTVMHGVRRIGDLIREDRDVFNVVQELTARIKRGRGKPRALVCGQPVRSGAWTPSPVSQAPVQRASPGGPKKTKPLPSAASSTLGCRSPTHAPAFSPPSPAPTPITSEIKFLKNPLKREVTVRA